MCRRTVAILVLGAAAIGGCVNSTNLASGLPVVGAFVLRAVNEAPIPYQNGTAFIVRGTLTVQGNSTYTLTEVDSAAGATTQLSSSGKWSLDNNAMALHDDNGTLYLAAVSGSADTVRVQISTHLNLYVRQ